jgi:parvulin-like peptidyl-prolyl isomerase
MKHLLKLFLIVFISFSSIFAQQEEDKIIAEVGPIKITLSEFKKRYEMIPQIGRHIKGRENHLKAETLYSIIAEKLWALESENLGFDSTDIMKLSFQNVKDMNLRDALYRRDIMDKVVILEETIAEAKRRALYYLNTKFIHSMDENEINDISKKIKNGASFDSILVKRAEYSLQTNDFYQIHFGQMAEFAENELFNLKLYDVSNPIKSPEGFYIFKLYSVENEIIENEKQAKNMLQNVNRVLDARANENVYQKFYKTFFPGREAKTDGEMFWSLSNKLIAKVLKRSESEKVKPGEAIHLDSQDFMDIKNEFGNDSLAMPFIFLKNETISLKQFIYSFTFQGFYTSFTDPNKIRAQLNSRVKLFIEQVFLTKEAEKEGLENLPEVKEDIKMWRDNYLATLYKQTLFDSSKVSDKEIEEHYAKSKSIGASQTLINVIEITSNNLDEIVKIFDQLDNGADFKEIAASYLQNESGLVTTSSKGEVGQIAKDLAVGEVYGPLEIENKYVIFKLIDKKEEVINLPKEFDEIKAEIKKELKGQKLSNKMIDNTVKLANKYGVTVNEKLLFNLPVTNYNMLVYRYMGFGGRLLAVPLTPTFIEWVEQWQKSKQDLP